MTSSEIKRQEIVHYFKSFTPLFSLFLLIEDCVTLICSGEGFQYLCLSRDWINLALQSKFPTTNLCILTHVLQLSQFTELKFENKSFWRPDVASKHYNIKHQYWDFKLRPKYSDPRAKKQFRTNGIKAERAEAAHERERAGEKPEWVNEEGIEQLSQSLGCNSSQGLKFERLCCLIKKCYLDL